MEEQIPSSGPEWYYEAAGLESMGFQPCILAIIGAAAEQAIESRIASFEESLYAALPLSSARNLHAENCHEHQSI